MHGIPSVCVGDLVRSHFGSRPTGRGRPSRAAGPAGPGRSVAGLNLRFRSVPSPRPWRMPQGLTPVLAGPEARP